MSNVSFLGLGVMGYPIAGHLARAGLKVTVFNRTIEKAKKWKEEYGCFFEPNVSKAVKESDFVFSCVGNDNDLREIIYGEEGAFKNMKKGSCFIDHTTASSNIANELQMKANDLDIGFIDAPVSGGEIGAINGKLTIMCGGRESIFKRALPLMKKYSQSCTLIGSSGAGQLAKMVNQICIAGLVQALSEGINFAEKNGLDTKKVLEAISKGAAGSWQLENRGKTMVDGKFDFGFAVELMRKDLGICLDHAEKLNISLPITAIVNQFYAEVQDSGGARFDTSSLITRFNK
ncbi:MAG: oxidoreductase [Rhodobacteraceae bacterium]|nr:MAG: oxidoreductase [Paracoccaceae bacterium]